MLGKRVEITALHKTGREFPVELAIMPTRIADTWQFTAFIVDITERKRAEEALARKTHELSDFIEHANVGMHWVGPDGIIQWANRSEMELLGYTAHEYIGHHIAEFHADQATIQDILKHLAAGEALRDCAVELKCKDGSIKHALVSSSVYSEDGKFIHSRCFTRDITERKAAEAGKLAEEVAVRANLAKSEFLSRMSHELRTPLNAILGFTQLLEMDPLTPDQRESTARILHGGRHLLNLINEVLDISRIEAGHLRLSLEPVSLQETVREALDLIRPLTAPRHITVRSDVEQAEGLHVKADSQRLRQVVLNLLSNAVKYNRESGRITVTSTRTADGAARVAVTDTGPGISPEKLARLFVPFDRLGAEQLGIEGTGLGLSLTKHLVEAMGGRLGMDSVVGQGSTFWVEMPVVPPPTGETAISRPATPADSSTRPLRTMLYIEDNLSNLELIQKLLATRPEIKLLSAMQGRLGLDLARHHKPDLILLDLHLPDLGGETVLLQLKAEPALREIPVIILSADASQGQIERLRASGAHAYLTKPLNLKQFLALLSETLAK